MIHYKSGDAGLSVAREMGREKIWQYRLIYRNWFYIITKYYGLFSPEMVKFIYRCLKDIIRSVKSGNYIIAKILAVSSGFCGGVILTLRINRSSD